MGNIGATIGKERFSITVTLASLDGIRPFHRESHEMTSSISPVPGTLTLLLQGTGGPLGTEIPSFVIHCDQWAQYGFSDGVGQNEL